MGCRDDLNISTWGGQGQQRPLHFVQEARNNHQVWLGLTSREQARLEAKFALGQHFRTPPMARKLKSILR
eukprot:12884638-Prorocentrum_lima.AAC.1